MLQLVEIMAHTGGGGAKVKFEAPFFRWLSDQILMIEDYAYVGMDFWRDPNLPLPPGTQWGDIGKKNYLICWLCFYIFMFYDFYGW